MVSMESVTLTRSTAVSRRSLHPTKEPKYGALSSLTTSQFLYEKDQIQNEKDQFQQEKKLEHLNRHTLRLIVVNVERGEVNRERPYLILENLVDITPLALEDSDYPNLVETRLHLPSQITGQSAGKYTQSFFDTISNHSRKSSLKSLQSATFSVHSKNRAFFVSSSRASISTEFFKTNTVMLEEGVPSLESDEELRMEELYSDDEERVPSLFRLREDPPPRNKKIDTKFTINLVGSETVFMLQLPSVAEPLETEEGKEILESNSLYEKSLQTVKPIGYASTQTEKVFYKSRKNCIDRNSRNNSGTFVSNWEMYDTYEAVSRVSDQISMCSKHNIKNEDYHMQFYYRKSIFSNRLLDALMIMERLIINRDHKENQLTFSGLLVQDPLSLDVTYSYSLKHLWTFQCGHIVNKRCVTSMCWNPNNHNLLAVGYGKFAYTEKSKGVVCIWNVKNPEQPERHYTFEQPVTYLEFSEAKTQILAVSLYSGLILLIDIISRSLSIKATNGHYPLTNPVWQIHWLPEESRSQGQIVTCNKNGKIYRYKKTNFFVSKRIMTISKIHGKVSGVYQPRKCFARKTPSPLSPSVEVITIHPSDPQVYLVGTSDGYVYFCSLLQRNDYIDVFVAHDGPVYNIMFSPFCNKVFLTCGADWCIRVWAEGIFKPLVTLESGMTPVQDALWSPLHSTIIISITGTLTEMWDLRRNTSKPKSSIKSPSNAMNTELLFTPNGYNICIGDAVGNVHVMGLQEMPFSPNFQEEVLIQALKNALVTRPQTLSELLMLGEPFSKRTDKRPKVNIPEKSRTNLTNISNLT